MSSIDKDKIDSHNTLESGATKDSPKESKILSHAKTNYPKNYEEKTKQLLSKYNLPIDTLDLKKLTGVFDLVNNEHLKESPYGDDKELIKTSDGRELIAMRKMEFLIGRIDSFCEENKINDPQDFNILLDFFLAENKGNTNQLEEIIIAGGGEKIKDNINEKRQIVKGYKDLINNPDSNESKILEFDNRLGDHILRSIFLTHGVLGLADIQTKENEERGEPETLSKKQKRNESLSKALDYLEKVREKEIARKRREIEVKKQEAEFQGDKVLIEGLSKELDKLDQEQKEFSRLIILKRKEYQDNIKQIQAELKKEIMVKSDVEPLENTSTIPGLESIKVERNNKLPKIESKDLPDFLPKEGEALQRFPNPIKALPIFQNNPNKEELSKQLILFQFFQKLGTEYSNDILSDKQKDDITDMQKKGRRIPFGPNDLDKKNTVKKWCDTIRKTVGPHIQKDTFDPIKKSILQRSNEEFIGPIKDADSSVLSGSLDRKRAHYDINGDIKIPNNFITPFSPPFENNTIPLEIKSGSLTYPQITGGEQNSNSPLLRGNIEIGKTKNIGEFINENSGTITKDLLHKALKSSNPQQTLLTEYNKNTSNNNPIDSEKLGEQIALSGSQNLFMSMLYNGHKSYEDLQNETTQSGPLDAIIKAILGKDNEKKGLQGDSTLYKDIQSILGSMKGWDISMHNRFSQAVSFLSELLKNANTESNIGKIIENSEDTSSNKIAYLASLSQSSRKEGSINSFMKLFMEGEQGEFNGTKFCNTVEELDFAINQGGGVYSFTHEPDERQAKKTIEESNQVLADHNLEEALNNDL